MKENTIQALDAFFPPASSELNICFYVQSEKH